MPKVDVKRDLLFAALGRTYTQQEFELLCFEYGIELDDVTSEKEMIAKEKGATKEAESASSDVIYKIDVPANRYDLLCLEGISRALLIFLGKMTPPKFHSRNPHLHQLQKIIVKPETQQIRSVVVAAILRNITFTQTVYESFIDLQEKLHQNICRKRTLVSIGTHDLDTIKGPFTYEALPPKEIKFTPLNKDKEMDADELFADIENTHSHLEPYLHIIKGSPVYPVIYDSNRVVLSLPPIINSNHSKIKLTTKNVLIEVTATDRTKANVVLNTILAMFSGYCEHPYSIESVEVHEVDGKVTICPDLSERTQVANVDYIKSAVGAEIDPKEIAVLLNRMSLPAELHGKDVQVKVPITRSDIMHACDIMEDVAIAYGYNNIQKQIPNTVTVGNPQPLNKVSDLLRQEVANAGYTEVLTFSLCSLDDNFKKLRRPDDGSAVILDSKSEFQCGRITLLGGMLRSVYANKSKQLPFHLFEVGDVFGKDKNSAETGAANKRMIAALHCATTSSFETIHGLLDRMMLLLRIPRKSDKQPKGYSLKPSEDPAFFPGRRVDVLVGDKKVGGFGVVHPEVLNNFQIPFPCTALELEITVDLARWFEANK